MRLRSIAAVIAVAAPIAGCATIVRHAAHGQAHHAHRPTRGDPAPLALMTAETRNELLAVDLRTGALRARVALPDDPEDVAVAGAVAVVVSPAARTVSLVSLHTLRVVERLHGFTDPHIAAVAPDRRYVYVTDDTAGTVTPIRLTDRRPLPSLAVGAGAHHVTFAPNGRTAWVALGEAATTIVELDTRNPAHPRITDRFELGFTVHDLRFTPQGGTVWLSSATAPGVTVVDARTHSVRFRIPVGPPPQHIVFGPGGAYLTSGYGGVIERVDPMTGRILDRARSPYGSFELDARGAYVATSSLLRGTLAIYDPRLRLRRTERFAPAAREVAIIR